MDKKKNKKKNILLINIEYFLAFTTILLLRWLSLKSAYRIGKCLSLIVYYLDFLHRKRAIQHIIHAGVAKRLNDNLNFELCIFGPIGVEYRGGQSEDIKKLTQKFTLQIETLIRQYPEQWLWCHRRWLDINRKKEKCFRLQTIKGG